ncbi:DUF5123 domain-containing protein [Bacteroidota bacterium]
MSRKLLVLFTVILNFSISIAQTPTTVEPGEGTLEAAIQAAGPNDILQLSGGGVYTLSSSATSFGKIGMPLTIQVDPGSAEKAILQLGNDAPRTKKYYFFTVDSGADLTLRGLDIHGLLNDTTFGASLLVFDARPEPSMGKIGNFRFENCIFHDFKDYIIHGMKDDYARGLIQDSVFIDNVIVYNAKHFLQYKHVSLRHLEMTNSTVYDMKGMALKIGKIGYRCVLENPDKPYIPITDETITPTGFIDHCTLDDMGDIHGHIQVDDAYQMLTISNCIISNQQQYDQPPVYFTDTHADTVVTIINTCFWKCGPPNSDVGGINWIGYAFQDTITMDPEYQDDINADFSIPPGSPLLSFGTNSDPIGDPRWIPEVAEAIRNNYADQFMLSNSPNPFQQHTNITFRLNKTEFVSLKIFDASGRVVATLASQMMLAGNHILRWNADGFGNGLYFCRLQSNNSATVRKLLLLRY